MTDSVFGHMWPVAHYGVDAAGERIRDGATTGTWPATNGFYRAVFDAYPDLVRRDGGDIVVSMLNGVGRYRVTGERTQDGAAIIDAVLVDLVVTPITEVLR